MDTRWAIRDGDKWRVVGVNVWSDIRWQRVRWCDRSNAVRELKRVRGGGHPDARLIRILSKEEMLQRQIKHWKDLHDRRESAWREALDQVTQIRSIVEQYGCTGSGARGERCLTCRLQEVLEP